MKKIISFFSILSFFLITTVSNSAAGSGYPNYSHRDYYGGHHIYYPSHGYRHYDRTDRFLAHLGVGLLAGAVVGSILFDPPRPTLVYTTPPRVIVQSEPTVVVSRPPSISPHPGDQVLRQVKITEPRVNLRSGPGLDTTIIGQVLVGETLNVIGAAPEWLYIRTFSGQYGWVMSQYTTEAQGPLG